jgi:tetrahydromethanopterin S-methyltransferase subunit B
LASGDYFKVPIIRYDDAGHILPASQEAVYYRMPVIDIISDIDNLEDAVDKLENISEEMDESIKTNAQSINSLKD